MLNFLYLIYLFLGLPIVLIIGCYNWFYKKKVVYAISSLNIISKSYYVSSHISKYIIFLIRTLILIFLILAIARLRSPDERSKIPVRGVDIIMSLDVSGSMQFCDDPYDKTSRFSVVKKEALKFIDKRPNDPIGVILFAQGVVSRCPLTLDKNILKSVLAESEIGIIDPEGTKISQSILTGLARLKNSTAKSKVIILLTDGQPSDGDVDYNLAIDMAKKMGVKIYAIGIGSKEGAYFQDPFRGAIRIPQLGFNEDLLQLFAKATGGKFFHAKNSKELESIYKIIDSLEKIENEVPIYSNYYEFFVIFLLIALILLGLEIFLGSLLWRRL